MHLSLDHAGHHDCGHHHATPALNRAFAIAVLLNVLLVVGEAIAGLSLNDATSELHKMNEAALNECWIRNEAAIWPAPDDSVFLIITFRVFIFENILLIYSIFCNFMVTKISIIW